MRKSIVKELGLNQSSNCVNTPSTQQLLQNQDVSELEPEKATLYRAHVARANYLAQDRSDIGFAVKELCRQMSEPRICDWERLKRLGRYLLHRTRVIALFEYQKNPQ